MTTDTGQAYIIEYHYLRFPILIAVPAKNFATFTPALTHMKPSLDMRCGTTPTISCRLRVLLDCLVDWPNAPPAPC